MGVLYNEGEKRAKGGVVGLLATRQIFEMSGEDKNYA